MIGFELELLNTRFNNRDNPTVYRFHRPRYSVMKPIYCRFSGSFVAESTRLYFKPYNIGSLKMSTETSVYNMYSWFIIYFCNLIHYLPTVY